MDISDRIISDPIIDWVFSNSGTEIFLVGGYIRDIMLGKTSKDRDFAAKKNPGSIAERFADVYDGTFIELLRRAAIIVPRSKS